MDIESRIRKNDPNATRKLSPLWHHYKIVKAEFSRQTSSLEDFTISSRPANNNASFSFNAPPSRVLIYT